MFMSRHFHGSDIRSMCIVPFPEPRAPDEDGVLHAHKLLAVGTFNVDSEQHVIAMLDLQVDVRPSGEVLSSSLSTLASWVHPGQVTDLQVSRGPQGSMVLLSGSSTGAMCRLQLGVPSAPGSQPSEIMLLEGGLEGKSLQPWRCCHNRAVAAVAHQPSTHSVLSAGTDGRIHLQQLDASSSINTEPWYDGGACVAFRDAAWASADTFVTVGTLGGLQLWDRRQGPSSLLESPAVWGPAGSACAYGNMAFQPQVTCVTCHEHRPHLAATGATGGVAAVWDLRFSTAPLLYTAAGDLEAGCVHEVAFDTAAASESGTDPLLYFCTGDGVLASSQEAADSATKGRLPPGCRLASVVYEEPAAALRCCAVSGGAISRELVVASDQECVLYIRQPTNSI